MFIMTTKPTMAGRLFLYCFLLALVPGSDALQARDISPVLDGDVESILDKFERCTYIHPIEQGPVPLLEGLLGLSKRLAPEDLARAWFGAFREPRYGRIGEELRRGIADEKHWARSLEQAQNDITYLDGITDFEWVHSQKMISV
uniref:DUF1549 domain-containing protein n=1 Tax=Candidatus Kentrum sp. FM TaxID=2126340 RepID=A0A450S9B1_9GAMM|nr:MAG: hypothetical protein BECKFM1743A_GA0114220_1004515 [Candidatus Kentron sp. FM]VFJ48625.1 MAG: hypothetical protein BECKFM1743C_GA0114222_1006114 [Candidatus Kentron sp. FM]VFK08070.1 MAG: hypothetical protein BECKFM1743B_GA0114221_1005813 [Candidatus Kentron sp. FM]